MPFAYLDNGVAVEIAPGEPFTTPQLKMQTLIDQGVFKYPVGVVIDHLTSHAANALDHYGTPDLDRYQIQSFPEASPPAGQVVATRRLSVTNGVISVVATFTATPVPVLVTRNQAWAELEANPSPVNAGKTLFDDICAAVLGAGDPALSAYFMGSQDYHRTHPRLLQAAALLAMTSAAVDALFISAATLPA